ncbi:hypothetical protein GGQ04_003202 [Salinibacter ruber]|uniref:hypothetical protein n=1 Tax=Salinibacter ruber TaxID=146919 RepID=UPI002169DC89|nr:hypothetical protein [Salinibacter ruber]MCS4048045.1 hypothetical protein [Salinibacter ruber]
MPSNDGQTVLLGGLREALGHKGRGLLQMLGRSGMDLKDDYADLPFGEGLLLGDAAVEGDEDLKPLFRSFA